MTVSKPLKIRKLVASIVACLLTCLFANTADAQWDALSAHYDNSDFQFFSPVDLDFNCNPIGRDCGYFFRYDKLSWAFTDERRRIGIDATTTASTNPYRIADEDVTFTVDDDDNIVVVPGNRVELTPATLVNNINAAPPRAEFGWGERYEIGKFDGETGWLIGILDGPEANEAEVYGFGAAPQVDRGGLLSPLGSVIVIFDDPQNLMIGYLDVLDGDFAGGGALPDDDDGDGILDGDGFADDIDEDGHHGPDGFDTETPAWIPDVRVLGIAGDIDDLVQLPTSFQTLTIRNRTETQGVEIMRTHRLDNRHRMAKNQNNVVEFAYGARYLRLRDDFNVRGEGGVLGSSFWNTRISNNIVGPQVALKLMQQRQRLRIDWSGRCLFGYNFQNWKQIAALGQDLIPGAHNHPLYFPPSYNVHGRQNDEFSPVVEVRVESTYQLTSAIAARLGYNAIFVDNIKRSAQQVKYELPNMGFRNDGGSQDIFINGINFGFDVVY